MPKQIRRSDAGMALLVAMLFMAVALIVMGALSIRLMGQRRAVAQFEIVKDCFQGVETAVANSVVEVEDVEDGLVGMGEFEPQFSEEGIILPSFESDVAEPEHMEEMPNVEYMAFAIDWSTDGRDNNGDGIIDDVSESFMWTIYGMARNGETTRSVEANYEQTDVNVWRNAIFAGAGQAGGLINGNVSIHGSVHLLGENLVVGGVALAALDLSGTSLIHNNYEGLDPSLRARVPALPQTVFDGEVVDTLGANLRVKNGLVGMSGTSEIGEPHVNGNAWKETMDGAYVNDGWTGNSVTDDGDRGDPSAVFSDNGWDETYDLGDKVSLPVLTDDWRDPITGDRVVDPDTGTWYTHEDYFNEVLLADPGVQNDGIYVGDIDLNARGTSYYWNATTGEEFTGAAAEAATPGPNDDYLQLDVNTNVLKINGQLRVDGNVTFRGQGNDLTINYSGRGAILAYGNITVDANLITCNNGDPNDTAGSFPVNNIIGLMAAQDMLVGTAAQLDIMGAFYAQGKIACAKQTDVMGTFVANYFDMGTNVPDIYQVPELADYLPMGMIGNYPILTMSRVSWRELTQ